MLLTSEAAALELRDRQVRDIREGDRIKTVLFYSEGWSTAMIAQALRKHEISIRRHLNGCLLLKIEKNKQNQSESKNLIFFYPRSYPNSPKHHATMQRKVIEKPL